MIGIDSPVNANAAMNRPSKFLIFPHLLRPILYPPANGGQSKVHTMRAMSGRVSVPLTVPTAR